MKFKIYKVFYLQLFFFDVALVAQEMDWLDKLEKRLRKSPKSAADAEEISEELDVCIAFIFNVVLGSPWKGIVYFLVLYNKFYWIVDHSSSFKVH